MFWYLYGLAVLSALSEEREKLEMERHKAEFSRMRFESRQLDWARELKHFPMNEDIRRIRAKYARFHR